MGPFVSMHGFGSSPILFDDMVILACLQQGTKLEGKQPGKSFFAAVDRRTGEVLWKTPRDNVVAAYSTPCVYRPPGGPPELICCCTAHGIYSMDPRTGQENWSLGVLKMRTVSSPIVVGGLVFSSNGSGGGGNYLVAVRPGKDPHEVYRITTQAPYVPTSVARGNLLFLWYDKGVVTCIDAPDGTVHWRQRVGGNFSGSPVRAGDRIFCISDEGAVVVLSAEDEFNLLARNPLGEPSRSTPAIAGGRMYVRTYSHLVSIGGKD
jgi:outer membrane protein assembly factor BamB